MHNTLISCIYITGEGERITVRVDAACHGNRPSNVGGIFTVDHDHCLIYVCH